MRGSVRLFLTPSSGICSATEVFHLLTSLGRQGIDLEYSMGNLFARACRDSALAGLLVYEAILKPHYLVVDWRAACPGDVLP